MPETGPLTEDLLATVARLNRAVSRAAALPLASALARFLAQLDDLGPMRVSDLARADGCTQPTATTAVQRLEALGYVSRSQDPDDARASVISLTSSGAEALAGVRSSRVEVLAPAVAGLTVEQRDALVDGLSAVRALLEHTELRRFP